MKRKTPDFIKEKVIEWNELCESRGIKKFNNYRIEINFKVGRCGNSFLSFEAFLLHHILLYILKEHRFNISHDFDEFIFPKIPIKKKFFGNDKDDYFYCCSGFFDIPNRVSFCTKRAEEPIINIVKDRRVCIKAGGMKNYKLPVLYSTQKKYYIDFFGDVELIEKLLYNNMNIGKNYTTGFGQCSFKIKEIEKFELFNNEIHHYIRPVPIDFIKNKNLPLLDEIIFCPIRPPYFGIKSKEYECCL